MDDPTHPDKTEPRIIHFNDILINNKIVDHSLPLKKDDRFKIEIFSTQHTPFFNVKEPGIDWETIYVGRNESAPDIFESVAKISGNYTIRVYQLGNSRINGRQRNYSIKVTIN